MADMYPLEPLGSVQYWTPEFRLELFAILQSRSNRYIDQSLESGISSTMPAELLRNLNEIAVHRELQDDDGERHQQPLGPGD